MQHTGQRETGISCTQLTVGVIIRTAWQSPLG